jgi:hypothetical protein
LSAFSYDNNGLQQFLKSVKADLSQTDESSGDAVEEFIKFLKPGDREKFETFYKTFRANEAFSALANGIRDSKHLSRESSYLGNFSSLQSSQVLQDNRSYVVSQPSLARDALPPFDVEFEPTLKYVELPAFDGIEASRREEAKGYPGLASKIKECGEDLPFECDRLSSRTSQRRNYRRRCQEF